MSDMQDQAFCPHCGSELGKDAVFCMACGNPVNSGTSADSDADIAAMLAEEGIAVSLDDLGGGAFDNDAAPAVDADAAEAPIESEPAVPVEPDQAGEEPVQSIPFDDIPVAVENPVPAQTSDIPPVDQVEPSVARQPETQVPETAAAGRPAKRGGAGAGLVIGAIAAGLIAFGGGFAGMTAILNVLRPSTGDKPAAVSDAVEKGAEKGAEAVDKVASQVPEDAPKPPENTAPKEPAPIEDAPTTGPLGTAERFDRLALNKFLSHFSETGMFDRIRTFDRNTANLEELDDFLLANGWQNHEPLPASPNPDSREVFVPVASADAMTDFYFGRRYDWGRNPNFTAENGLSFVVDDVTALGPAVADWVEQGEGNTVRVGFAAYSTPFSEMPNPEGIQHRDVENIYGLDDEGYAKTPQEMRDYMGVAPRLLGTATLEATRTDDGHWRLIMLDYRID